MRLLLDTHAAVWWLSGDDRFGREAARRLEAGGDELLLSAVVVWEVAIKRALGRLDAPDDLVPAFVAAGAVALPVHLEHAVAVEGLEHHHRDPFDRMLVAQARVEGAAIVSRDEALRPYGVPLVW